MNKGAVSEEKEGSMVDMLTLSFGSLPLADGEDIGKVVPSLSDSWI